MCKLCKEALDKHFPDLSWQEKSDILMDLTAFPFADGEYTANQIAKVAEIGIEESYRVLEEDMDRALKEMYEREEMEHKQFYG